MARNRARTLVVATILVSSVILVFWPALGHEFLNYDDDIYVTENPQVTRGLSGAGFVWAWTSGHAANWHPLTWLSHMLDVSVFGLSPAGHHASSVLLHALNTLLAFIVLRRLTGSVGRSALVALLFAIHPLHVESVAWIAERKELLSSLFFWLMLWTYSLYAAKPSVARYVGVAFLLAMGLTAKPMLVTAPALLLLLDFWPLERHRLLDWKRLILEKLPLFLLVGASSWITWVVQGAGGALGGVTQYPLSIRAANAALSYATYAIKTVWPRGLAVFYLHPGTEALSLLAVGTMAMILIVTVTAVRRRREQPYLLVGWLWFLGTLVPVIGLVQVGEQAMADRYTYLPLTGLLIALVWSVARPLATPMKIAVIALLMSLAVVAHLQVRHWKDSATLFRHALTVTADNATSRLNLGMALSDRGEFDSARVHLRKAIELRPGWARAHNNLGWSLAQSGRHAEADSSYHEALRRDPTYADAYFNLGHSLTLRGLHDEALDVMRKALALEPDSARAHYSYGTVLAQRREWAAAAEELQRALAILPEHAEAHYNLALVLHFRGDAEGARRELALARRYGFEPPAESLRLLTDP